MRYSDSVEELSLNSKIPQHVAIIMDGNGRWAKQRGLARSEGHRAGINSVKRIIQCCLEKKISVLSLFAFSSENWLRPENEVEFLMALFLQALNTEVNELHQHGVCIQFTGLRDGLSLILREQMEQAEGLTINNRQLILNIVINYGGRWDIVNATQAIAKQVLEGKIALHTINENLLRSHLSTKNLPEPDLFIRTSGEHRISNFFLWQLAYTELYFTPTHWPDFTSQEFEKALTSFGQRERRYGKTSQQLEEISNV